MPGFSLYWIYVSCIYFTKQNAKPHKPNHHQKKKTTKNPQTNPTQFPPICKTLKSLLP